MGYECPVCATPQADARHLANHMAFTAVLGDSEHETWLDEHAPGWSEAGESELAPRVAEHAPEGEFEQVFEDTVGGLEESNPTDPLEERSGALFDDETGHTHGSEPGRGHDHDHGHGHDRSPPHESTELDEETREVLEEAREMTREMLEEEAGKGDRERNPESESAEDDEDEAREERDGHGG
jgi:hypothetical protein